MTIKTTTSFALVILMLVSGSLAGETAFRPWAETGDEVGLFNHVTVGFESLDEFGYNGRSAEDWSRVGDTAFTGLFAWTTVNENSHFMTLRGFGENRSDGDMTGAFDFSTGTPGVYGLDVQYRRANRFYDGTIEQRHPMPVPPTELDALPSLRWCRGQADGHYALGKSLTLRFFADDIRRKGSKASLARGTSGLNPPAIKTFDTKSMRLGSSLEWKGSGLRADVGFIMGRDEGDRDRSGTHSTVDDQEMSAVRGGVAWDATKSLTILSRGGLSTVNSKPVETAGGEKSVDLEQSASTGVVAALWRPSSKLNARVSARVHNVEVDGTVGPVATDQTTVDRERSRTTLNAAATWRATGKTRVDLGLRHDVSDLDETLTTVGTDPVLAGEEVTSQKRTTTRMTIKGRHRLTKSSTLKGELRVDRVDIVQNEPAGERYWQGDRTFDSYRASLGLALRPSSTIRFEFGGQSLHRTFERTDVDDVENTFNADRMTATASWLAGNRLSLYGAFSWGHEIYELTTGAEAPDGAADIVYDTTTLRMAPGAVLSLPKGIRLEGSWELVRNLDSVENDYDRMTVRGSYPLTEKATVTALFRKYEFDENRWDDYILDLYAVMVSTRF